MAPARPALVQPDTGTDLYAFGEVLSLLLGGAQSGGAWTVLQSLIPVGGASPVHRHTFEDELCLVVDGRLSYLIDHSWTEVAVGGLVYLPRGTVHAYRNVGLTPARHWLIYTPPGLEVFFEQCAAEFNRLGGPDEARVGELFHRFGLELISDASAERTGTGDN